MVEYEEFQALIQYINNTCDEWLPYSHNIVNKWVSRIFRQEQEHIRQSLHSVKSKIHFSCDLWTSPNSLAILGVIIHFIIENGELRQAVLGLKEVKDEHTREHLASKIMEVVEIYGIASKLGYFMMDNASNNDIMMFKLSLCK